MTSLVLLGLLVCGLAIALVRSHIAAQKRARCTWDDLLAKLQPVPRDPLTAVAHDYLNPTANQLVVEPSEIWAALGGLAGLERIRGNAAVLIELAAYAQRWNNDECAIVAERMRHDAVQLRRALLYVQFGFVLRYGRVRMPFYLHQVAANYHLMTMRLLALYETSHAGLYPRLAEAL